MSLTRKLRVFLADDHVVLREGLAMLIAAQSDMEVVGQASEGRELLREIGTSTPNIVVMDVGMPGMNGVHATIQVRELFPDVQIVALSRYSESGYINQMFRAGSRGYVLKQAGGQELLDAIRNVAAGGTYLDSTLTYRAVQHFVHGQAQPDKLGDNVLSERETEVVRLTAFGYTNKEIATQIGVGVKTVDTYKMRAMEKLGLHSRAALVRYALESGWFDQAA